MPFAPFNELFPEIAEKETRSLTIIDDSELPAGNYGLIEMYCNEPDCDCRRVFFSVLSSKAQRIVAVIAYGWESADFYARWMGDDDPQVIMDLKGPVLNLGSPQSKWAPAILKIVQNVVLQDTHYVERLKVHYKIFRAVIDHKGNTKGTRSQRKSRIKRLTRSRKRPLTRGSD